MAKYVIRHLKVNRINKGKIMTDVVIFQELDCDNGKKVGLITLNSPKSLNALSGDMVALLYPQLVTWQQQQDIAAVFLQGEGEKAFCAGGDIVHLYSAMKNSTMKSNSSNENSVDNLNAGNRFAPELSLIHI